VEIIFHPKEDLDNYKKLFSKSIFISDKPYKIYPTNTTEAYPG
jgi:hypothetical protein